MGQLEITGLKKVYDDGDQEITAVEDFNISIEDGEFIVLVGPSGCGKSTTLRSIAGLETVTEGTIKIGGKDVTREEPGDRNLAMVFQNYALYPHFDVTQNLSFGLKMSTDLSQAEIDQRVSEVMEMLDIKELADKEPQSLSGGQQQRVALGRALVRDPAVFLMDEPLSNLDAKLRTQMRTRLQDLQYDLDVTTVYVTHDQTEAMTMSDRIVVMNEGHIQQIGTPLECYYEPTNEFVASFIGSPSMNFTNVSITDRGLSTEEFDFDLSFHVASTVAGYDTVTLGIRPEDLQVAGTKADQTVHSTVRTVEPMGDITHITVEIGHQQWNVTIHGNIDIRPDDELELTFNEESLYLFDPETGETLKYNEQERDQNQPSNLQQ